jgi:alpha-beta hydrolase superfamily lysophospholipase
MKKSYLTVLLLTLTACSATTSSQSESNLTSTPPQNGSTTKSLTRSPATTLPTNTSIPSPSPATSSPSPSEPPIIQVSATSAATVQDVRVDAADGLVITGTFHPASGPPPWSGVLLLHMVYGDRSQWDELVPLLTSNGYAVVAIDMRGHGSTGGEINWGKSEDDIGRVWSYMTEREDIDPSHSALIGASMGANMALVSAANQPEVNTVVLLSPGLNYYGVTTSDALEAYGQRPILIVASSEDTNSAESSQELVKTALGESKLLTYDGAGHGTAMLHNEPELQKIILAWLDQYLK